MLAAMVFPLVQLVILGNAFGDKVTGARMGVVDYDGGPQALRVWEAFDAIGANARTFQVVSVRIGGGLLYIDDKARGVHEGFLVTPITKLELVFGLVASGAIKAVMAGLVITVLGALILGLGVIFRPAILAQLLLMIAATSFAFNAMMFLMMVRIEDPLVPRAMFGILNTLLFFPSGAIYPIHAFPSWLRALATVDPFTYAVHGFKAILLKEAGFQAIVPDLLFLAAIGALTLATRLFKRTL